MDEGNGRNQNSSSQGRRGVKAIHGIIRPRMRFAKPDDAKGRCSNDQERAPVRHTQIQIGLPINERSAMNDQLLAGAKEVWRAAFTRTTFRPIQNWHCKFPVSFGGKTGGRGDCNAS